jgi:hypothetical protein
MTYHDLIEAKTNISTIFFAQQFSNYFNFLVITTLTEMHKSRFNIAFPFRLQNR